MGLAESAPLANWIVRHAELCCLFGSQSAEMIQCHGLASI